MLNKVWLALVLLLPCLAWPGMGWGAIAVTDTSTATAIAGGSSITFAQVVASGDTTIYVGVQWTHATATISSVVFNTSESLTNVCTINNGNERTAVYAIVAPTVTTANIVVTFSGAVTVGVAGAFSASGVESSSVAASHRTAYTNTGNGTGVTVTTVDSASGDLVMDSAVNTQTTMGTVGTAQTSRAQDDSVAGGARSWGLSTEPAVGASTVMSWAGTVTWATCATSLVPTIVSVPMTQQGFGGFYGGQ